MNLPSRDLVVQTDYVGLVSGRNTDKSGVFEVFYGGLESAPLITECPVNMECRLHSVLDFTTHDIFVGQIVATHADPEVLTGGKIDLARLQPLLFDMSSVGYFGLGDRVADAWSVGKKLKRKLEA